MPAVDPHDLGRALDGRFVDAVAYAARTHRGQVRKGGQVPYLAHLMGVATLVLEYGGNEVQATVAVLHDAAEDQGGQLRLDDIRLRFGDEVADLVEEMSDAVPRRGEEPQPWRPRKEAYLADLRAAVAAGSPAVLVAACDKLDNVESVIAHATDPDAGHPDAGRPDGGHRDGGHPDDGHRDDGHRDDGRSDDGRSDDGRPDDGQLDDEHPDADHHRPTSPRAPAGFAVFGEFPDGASGASWYYRSLLQVFEGSDLPVRLLGRLRAAVGTLDALAEQADHADHQRDEGARVHDPHAVPDPGPDSGPGSGFVPGSGSGLGSDSDSGSDPDSVSGSGSGPGSGSDSDSDPGPVTDSGPGSVLAPDSDSDSDFDPEAVDSRSRSSRVIPVDDGPVAAASPVSEQRSPSQRSPEPRSPEPRSSEQAPVDTRPTGRRVFEVEGSPAAGDRPSDEAGWRQAVVDRAAGTGPARTLRLDFRVAESRREVHIDDLVHPVLAGLREAGVFQHGFAGLDGIHVTKAVGQPPGVTMHLDAPETDSWPPTPAVLDLRSATVPTVSRASRHHWALSVAEAYRGKQLSSSAWIEVVVATPRALEGVMKPVIDGLEAVLGRDPSGLSGYLAPNDHRVTQMRVVRHADLDTAIRVRVGPID